MATRIKTFTPISINFHQSLNVGPTGSYVLRTSFVVAAFVFSLISSAPVQAVGRPSATSGDSKSSATKKTKDSGQDGVVKVDGAAVYEVQNFDAPVMEYLDSGKAFKISKKIYPGVGGLGSFYKIKLRKGVFGYIADTDIAPKRRGSDDSEAESAPAGKPEEKLEKLPTDLSATEEINDGEPVENKNSFYLMHYFGLAYYSLNFAEQISNNVKNANTAMYGVKKTGPTTFMGGMPLDMSFLITTTAPSFYNNIASKTSGMMIFGDVVPFFTLSEGKAYYSYWGFGLVGRYSRWSVSLLNQPSKPALDSEELALGVEAALGAAFKLGQKVALRVDGRYYYEKQHYFGFGTALEFRY